jgi:Bacterial EndoU nuclease
MKYIGCELVVGDNTDQGQVEEIVILKDIPHPTVPGVRQIEYKIPAIDGTKNPLITTGALKGDGAKNFTKTIYDPTIWSDVKLEQALKEAIQDVANRNNGNILSEFFGSTKEGYVVHGYYRNGKITSFFFE